MRIKKGMVSYTQPVHIDSESSPTTVYINKNIKRSSKQLLEVESGKFKDVEIYTYDMYIYTKDEFELVEQFLENDELLHSINEKTNNHDAIIHDLLNRISVLENELKNNK